MKIQWTILWSGLLLAGSMTDSASAQTAPPAFPDTGAPVSPVEPSPAVPPGTPTEPSPPTAPVFPDACACQPCCVTQPAPAPAAQVTSATVTAQQLVATSRTQVLVTRAQLAAMGAHLDPSTGRYVVYRYSAQAAAALQSGTVQTTTATSLPTVAATYSTGATYSTIPSATQSYVYAAPAAAAVVSAFPTATLQNLHQQAVVTAQQPVAYYYSQQPVVAAAPAATWNAYPAPAQVYYGGGSTVASGYPAATSVYIQQAPAAYHSQMRAWYRSW